VVDGGGAFEHDDRGLVGAGCEAELGGGGPGIADEAGPEPGVHPGTRDELGTVQGTDVLLEAGDDGVDQIGLHEAALDQQRFQRFGPERVPARDRIVVVIVIMVVVIGGHAGSR
jgi:hypothetical protein